MARYRILDKLGEGGMGLVYRALQIELNREVALKILPAHGRHVGDQAARFHREVRTADLP